MTDDDKTLCEPIAWKHEHFFRDTDGAGYETQSGTWHEMLSWEKPSEMAEIRNIRPLYEWASTEAADLLAVVDAERDRVLLLEHIANDLIQHIDWLTHGLPEMLESAALTDEEGLIAAAIDAANSARAAVTKATGEQT